MYEALHDNGLVLTSLRLDLAKKAGFEKLELNVSYAAGLERAREGNGDWHTQRALLAEVKAEYRGVGVFHTWYTGKGQMYFFNDHHNEFYWGDPMYQADSFHEQMLKVSFDANHYGNREQVKLRYLWSHCFN